MTPNAATAALTALSTILTGETALAPSSVSRHLKTLREQLGNNEVDAVLDAFATLQAAGADLVAGVQNLLGDARLGPTVRAMLLLWFTGQTAVGGAPTGAPEDYLEALMWTAVGAHAPAFSNGYYGHWRYPPETGA